MTRPTRELRECVVAHGPIQAKGRASFTAQVSRLLREGYTPLGYPHYVKDNATLTMIKKPNE